MESNYIFSPLVRNFLSFVNITAIILKVRKWRKTEIGQNQGNSNSEIKAPKFSIQTYYSDKVVKPPPDNIVNELDRSDALEYIFKVETKIVKKFNEEKKLKKIAFEKDNILYCQTRVMEGQTVKVVGGLDIDMICLGCST